MPNASSAEGEAHPGNGLRFEHVGELPVYRFEPWGGEPALVHAILTRLGGVSLPPFDSLNLSQVVGDDPAAVATNYERVCGALGIRRSQMATCYQMHSADVLSVTTADGGRLVGQGDAMITDQPGVYLSMRFADCTPLLLHDPVRRAVGIAHAGWRGTLKNMAGAVVRAMVERLGCLPGDITAVVGPAIGPCCYQVGSEVIQAAEAARGDAADLLHRRGPGRAGGRAYFDLWETNRRQFVEAGVGRVAVAELCTACRTDRFFSHRAEQGRSGRFAALIGYRE
jgi:YfiH family protein